MDISNKKVRVALGIEYDGTYFHGWQRQDYDGLATVQAAIEEAVSTVGDAVIDVFCAGRTDAGVHALEQVVHFDSFAERNEHAWVFGANSHLPQSIRVLWAKFVTSDFHARYSAVSRRYRYVIYNHPLRPCLLRNHVSWYHRPLDEQRMAKAAAFLLGEHDFSSFRGSDCQSPSPRRIIEEITVQREKELIILNVKADSFLHHMVRNIVGVLLEIGDGRREVSWINDVLQARNRKEAGITAAPQGLYLVEVDYPDHYGIPKANQGTSLLPMSY